MSLTGFVVVLLYPACRSGSLSPTAQSAAEDPEIDAVLSIADAEIVLKVRRREGLFRVWTLLAGLLCLAVACSRLQRCGVVPCRALCSE